MKNKIAFSLILSVAFLCMQAQETRKPFQLALYNPVQIVPQDQSVHGFRFNFLYGENTNMVGFDMGLVNITRGYQHGAQFGMVNIADQEFNGARFGFVNINGGQLTGYCRGIVNIIDGGATGWISGWVNILDGDIKGLLTGPVNIQHGRQFKGAMIGWVNITEDLAEDNKEMKKSKRKGVQFGLVNIAKSLKGVQIGLVNVNKSARIKVFPFLLISKKS